MNLTELFDAPFSISSLGKNKNDYEFGFKTTSGQEYRVGFLPQKTMLGKPAYVSVSFAKYAGGKYDMSRSGNGEAFRVLATVVEAMKEYLRTFPHTPAYHFVVDKVEDPKGNVEKLYNDMMDKLVPAEWDIKFVPSQSNQQASYIITIPPGTFIRDPNTIYL